MHRQLPFNIAVHAFTEEMIQWLGLPDDKLSFDVTHPVVQIAKAEDIANLASFFAGQDTAYITG